MYQPVLCILFYNFSLIFKFWYCFLSLDHTSKQFLRYFQLDRQNNYPIVYNYVIDSWWNNLLFNLCNYFNVFIIYFFNSISGFSPWDFCILLCKFFIHHMYIIINSFECSGRVKHIPKQISINKQKMARLNYPWYILP